VLPADAEAFIARRFNATKRARLKVDYGDVIVEGEYVPRKGELVRVRNLNEPIADDL
jgi:hypothetical protein